MCCMSPCELVSFVTAVACSISKCCDKDDIELLGVVFTQLGDTLLTISVQNGKCNNTNQKEEVVEGKQ